MNERIERFTAVVRELETGDWANSLELSDKEKSDFIDQLDGNIYGLTAIRRNYVVLRLDSFKSDGAATYTPATLTIEHVLPQTPKEGGQWLEWWPDEDERKLWTHKIANLVPLPRPKNSEAQNYEFEVKKDKYFKSRKTGTSSYALTTAVLSEHDWKPETVKRRQAELLQRFKMNWEL